MIELTEHSKERAKERMSWNAETLQRMAQKAYDGGFMRLELKARLRRFIDKKCFEHNSTPYIYGEVVYFFRKTYLITLYLIPNDLRGKLKKLRKR